MWRMRLAGACLAWFVAGCDGDDGDAGDSAGGTTESSASSEGDGAGAGCPEGELPCNDMCLPAFEPTLGNVHAQVLKGCTANNCHGDAGPAENLVVTSPADAHENMVSVASLQDPGRNLVEPGNPAESYLLSKLTGEDMAATASDGSASVRMPVGFPPICEARLQLVEDWIAAGAPP